MSPNTKPSSSDRDRRRARALDQRRRQRHKQRRSSRNRWLLVGALAAAAVLAVLLSSSGDDTPTPEAETETAGIHTGAPPWPPVYDDLAERVEQLGFPPVGDESYHAHALLSVFVDGEQVEVPENIGIHPRGASHSPLHTHTPDGVIHLEADDPYPFTLADIFTVWGVDFGEDRVGGLRPSGTKVLQVYVNGEVAADGPNVELKDGDNIVVGYGEPGSFPTEPPADALEGA